jgi:hypothetical protein
MKAIIIVLSSVLLLALHASTSVAQVPRTFVSGLGSDGKSVQPDCTFAEPSARPLWEPTLAER